MVTNLVVGAEYLDVRLYMLTFSSQEITARLPVSYYKLGPRWDDVITWSDFKSETSFGFLSPNYTGQYMYLFFFVKTKTVSFDQF